MRFKELQILLVSLIFIFSCGDSDFSGIAEGQVLTQSGAPISDVKIHINYPELEESSKRKPTRMIAFNLPSSTELDFKITRRGTNKYIQGFENRSFSAGSHTIPIYDSLFTTGIYDYSFDSEVFSRNEKLIFIKTMAQLINDSPGLTVTDNTGKFTLETSIFGIGEEFIYTGDSPSDIRSFTITNEVEFIAVKNDEIIARKTVMISESSENNVELIVQN